MLVEKIQSDIFKSEQSRMGSCSKSTVKKIILESSVRNESGKMMTAREQWFIDRCGRTIIYRVDYYGPITEATNTHVQLIAQ